MESTNNLPNLSVYDIITIYVWSNTKTLTDEIKYIMHSTRKDHWLRNKKQKQS